jgi:adenylate cyclase
VWAERFERDTADLFALQNEITGRIAVALNLALVGAEAARPTANPDALDYIFRGRAAWFKPRSRDRDAAQITLFERALALDPHSVDAQALLAIALTNLVINGVTESAAADIARAEGLAGQALAASPRSYLAHFARGNVLRAQRRYAEAIPEYETVLASNRNSVNALHALGQCKLFAGSIEEVIPHVEEAIRLSPRDPFIGIWYLEIGRVHLLQSRTDEAIVWLEKARGADPAAPAVHALLASAYGLKGEIERAAIELAEARRLSAVDRYTSIARWQAAAGNLGVPKIRALYEATYLVGLRKAGMPEE